MTLILWIFVLVFSFFLPYFPLRLTAKFLTPKSGRASAVGRYFMFLIAANMIIQISDPVNILYTLPVFCSGILFLYCDPVKIKCAMLFVLYPLIMVINALCYVISALCYYVKLPSRVPAHAFFAALFWSALWLIIQKILPKARYTVSSRTWTLIGMLALLPMMATFSSVVLGSLENWGQLVMTLPFAAFSSILLLLSIAVFAKQEQAEQENQLYQSRAAYWKRIEEEQQQLRKLRHDLANHFSVLSGFLKQQEPEKASAYLQELSASPGMLSNQRFCENETVNIVLSNKLPFIQAAHIDLKLTLSLPPELPFSAPALCSLFANALDNAYEACLQVPAGRKRAILLQARVTRGRFMLRVSNTYASLRTDADGRPVTAKPHPELHGFGLRNIQSIAEEYSGICEIQADEGVFELVFSCPA